MDILHNETDSPGLKFKPIGFFFFFFFKMEMSQHFLIFKWDSIYVMTVTKNWCKVSILLRAQAA